MSLEETVNRWNAELIDLRELRRVYSYGANRAEKRSNLEKRITAVEWIMALIYRSNQDRPHGPVSERFMRHHYGASGFVSVGKVRKRRSKRPIKRRRIVKIRRRKKLHKRRVRRG